MSDGMVPMSDNNRNVPAGGPANINGVLYQLLWSLLRASRARFAKQPIFKDDEFQEFTLVLEPVGGGGDLVVYTNRRRTVEQLKARPGGGTWSLREVIESVIPDLYLADDRDSAATDYQFVTEGRMGKWKDVYKFFRSLKSRECPEGDFISDLDNTTPLFFSTRKTKQDSTNSEPPFWELGEYTERSLFEKVVSEVRKRESVRSSEDEAATQRKLRKILGHFEFVGGQNLRAVQQEIDSHLFAVVDHNDDLARVRDSLAMELARRATEGDAEIQCEKFFAEQGLRAIPLTRWGSLRAASHRVCESTLQNFAYDQALDVRLDAANQTLADWPATAPVLALTGESGCGKSWREFAICALGQPRQSLSVLITAGRTLDATLDRASAAVWQEIAGHDQRIPLSQVAQRVCQVPRGLTTPWLTLLIEGMLDDDQATEFVRQRWEDWGVRVVITVAPRTAATLEVQSQGRCAVVRVGDFTNAELQRYLEAFLGEGWTAIPGFVRASLRKPVMASIYRQLAQTMPEPEWKPKSEYEILSAFWARVQNQEPLDSLVLVRLAERHLAGSSYPWNDRDIAEVGGNNDVIRRLEAAGWLRVTHAPTGVSFDMSHARLLNWACAHAFLAQLRRREIKYDSLGNELLSILSGTSTRHGHRLRFVPMDLLWLMCQDTQVRHHVPEAIARLDGDYVLAEVLYKHLLPTLGTLATDPLAARLRAMANDAYLSRLIAGAIGTIGGSDAVRIGMSLLRENDPMLNRAALPIFAACPSPGALDQLWQLHNACKANPEEFAREREQFAPQHLYEETYAALRACCRESPGWLTRTINNADPSVDAISDLGYLLANIGGEEGRQLWITNRAQLFAKVPPEKRRCLVHCIDRYADHDQVQWLIECVGERQDLLGPRALSCLARLKPNEAVQYLHMLPPHELAFVRNWFLDQLFVVAAEATRGKLQEMMREPGHLWSVARIYDGRVHFLDRETLDLLLDDLGQRLSQLLSDPNWQGQDSLYGPLHLLAQINTKDLIDHLGRRRGSGLEAGLCELVERIGPRPDVWADSHVRDEAIELLYRIQGDGFSAAVNSFLRAESRYGRWDGLELAGKRPNADTIRLLIGITEQEETWDGNFIEQCDAAKILAEHGVWEPVIALVRKIGMKVLRDTTDLPRQGRIPSPELLQQIAESVSNAPGSASAGDVLALGFGNSKMAEIIRAVANSCVSEGDVAHACVVALDMLDDHDERSVPFLAQQLRIQEHNFSATNALITNGTPAALGALSHHAGENVSGAVAVNLVTRLADPSAAIRLARDTIVRAINAGVYDYASEMYETLSRIDDKKVVSQMLEDHSIGEYLRVQAFSDASSSSKVHAICCLSHIDPRIALLAAKTALTNHREIDRESYPPILAEMDSETATSVFVDLLETEKSEPLRRSVGRTLWSLNVEDAVIVGLASQTAARRKAACDMAGWARDSERVTAQLAHCLADSDEFVARTAAKAFDQLSIRLESQLLGRAIMDAANESERWLYLDCLISLADPGDRHRTWPVEGPDIGQVLTPLQAKQAMKRLERRRQKDKKA